MGHSKQPTDEQLIATLRATLDQIDPTPEDVTNFAKVSFGWRDIVKELTEITFDSTTDDPGPVSDTR